MKKILLAINISAFFLSCNNDTNSISKSKTTADSVNAINKSTMVDTSFKNLKDTVVKQQPNNELANKIIGAWAFVGTENSSFVIEKKKIYYPETFASYKYLLVKDSVKIKYDDYTGSYLVKMKGLDTLILISDEEQIYYRLKN